jgi:hypothetical protein
VLLVEARTGRNLHESAFSLAERSVDERFGESGEGSVRTIEEDASRSIVGREGELKDGL